MAIQGYIINLPQYENSVQWANEAFASAINCGWNVSLFNGVNGHTETLNDYNVKIYQGNKKCIKYLQRPGTQGCFLSHYKLWLHCVEINQPIFIFEHDVLFNKPTGIIEFTDIIKFEGFFQAKPINPGNWWEGARAYGITPSGASKILDWVNINGAMPADWMLCDGIVDIVFDYNEKVVVNQHDFSFTKDL